MSLEPKSTESKGITTADEHENQISEGGEADLHRHLAKCEKNPGHIEFIPITSFKLKHLPESHRDNDLVDLIKATADLVVRVSVKMVSPDRPDFWPNTEDPYFLSHMRGKTTFRSGTGRVSKLRKYADDLEHGPCPCGKCKASDTPSKVWWEIYVDTATHVVFDDTEADHTELRLFYDSDKSPLVVFKDMFMIYDVSVEEDWCMFSFVTCDESVASVLLPMLKRYNHLCERVNNRYAQSREMNKFNFIVSHPHGCSKQVSVGQWMEKEEKVGGITKFTYTTCTCPGSSGAHVHCVGYTGDWYDNLVHSGSRTGINYSAHGYVW